MNRRIRKTVRTVVWEDGAKAPPTRLRKSSFAFLGSFLKAEIGNEMALRISTRCPKKYIILFKCLLEKAKEDFRTPNAPRLNSRIIENFFC